MEVGRIVLAVHLEHPALGTLEVIFKGETQHSSLMYFVLPQLFARTDMIGDLCHQKCFADFWRSGKDICPGIEQFLDDRRSALIGSPEKFCHGNRVKVTGIAKPLHPSVHFFQSLLGIFNFLIDFLLRSGKWVYYSQ